MVLVLSRGSCGSAVAIDAADGTEVVGEAETGVDAETTVTFEAGVDVVDEAAVCEESWDWELTSTIVDGAPSVGVTSPTCCFCPHPDIPIRTARKNSEISKNPFVRRMVQILPFE